MNDGIVVLAPNFRGSTGYGKSFNEKMDGCLAVVMHAMVVVMEAAVVMIVAAMVMEAVVVVMEATVVMVVKNIPTKVV